MITVQTLSSLSLSLTIGRRSICAGELPRAASQVGDGTRLDAKSLCNFRRRGWGSIAAGEQRHQPQDIDMPAWTGFL